MEKYYIIFDGEIYDIWKKKGSTYYGIASLFTRSNGAIADDWSVSKPPFIEYNKREIIDELQIQDLQEVSTTFISDLFDTSDKNIALEKLKTEYTKQIH